MGPSVHEEGMRVGTSKNGCKTSQPRDKPGMKSTKSGDGYIIRRTFQGVDNEIHMPGNQEIFQFLRPQVLGCKVAQSNVGILVTSRFPRGNLKREIRPCLFQRCEHEIRLE